MGKQSAEGSASADSARQEFLAFTLGEEEYGINILKVQEIRSYEPVTRIANMPEFIKGVVNLRGTIVPIVDLRIKFKLGQPTYDEMTVVIILDLAGRAIGLVVDTVSDVIDLDAGQIKPPPDLGLAFDTRYLVGLGIYDARMVILIDIEKLMSSTDMALINSSAI